MKYGFISFFILTYAAHIGSAQLTDPQSSGAFDWNALSVKVDASIPVLVQTQCLQRANDFTRLGIGLTNAGEVPLTIETIQIDIPFVEPVPSDTEVVYGSSSMGRDPLLRERVSDDGPKSFSHMYEIVKVSEEAYLFAGSLSWRTFLPVFKVTEKGFQIESDGEGKQLQPGETLFYEAIVLSEASDWDGMLDQFGKAIARENGIKQVKDIEFTGWATWDYYSGLFRTEDVIGNMAALDDLYPQANLVQIDGGWWTARGDYMSVRPDLEGGIKAMADCIRADGKIAGLHIDGFRADTSSEIYEKHPEYFLHDQDGKIIVWNQVMPGREMNHIFFDYSHPGARAHIAKCIELLKSWGITYFKVDFMRYGLESQIKRVNSSVKSFSAHDPSLSGLERFRLGMKAIADAIGDENYFLGCSAVFGPCIGFVDGMRTGGDIHPKYEAFPERVLANSGNYYLNGIVWNADADYLVFRSAEDEDDRVSQNIHKHGGDMTLNEAQMWADYSKLYGAIRLSSDNLMILRPYRKALVREVFDWPAMDKSVPVDLWESGADKSDGFELILARSGDRIFLGVFNWGDRAKTYDLSAFGMESPLVLDGRHSKVIAYHGNNKYDQVIDALKAR